MTDIFNKKGGNENIIFILVGLLSFVVMVPYLAPAVFLTTLISELNIPVASVGYIISIYLIMAGICMFLGSYAQTKIGYIESFVVGAFMFAIGVLITATANNFLLFMLGRALSGVGYGFTMTAQGVINSLWFKGKKFTAANTFGIVLSCLGVSLAYALTPTLLGVLNNSWRSVTWVYFGMTIVYALLCLLIIKYPDGVGEQLKLQRKMIKAGTTKKQENDILRAFKYKDYWILMIVGIAYICINTALLTFMSTYFTTEAGFSMAQAGLVASMFSIAQIGGSLLGGVAVAQTGRRKIFLIIFTVLYALGMYIMVSSTNYGLVIFMAIIAGGAGFAKIPAQTQYYIEETGTPDPALIGPAAAMTNGIPMIANIVISGVLSLMVSGPLGYGNSLKILAIIVLITTIPLLLLNEVGTYDKRFAKTEQSSPN